MNEEKNCPICGEGRVTGQIDQVEAEYNGHVGMTAELRYAVANKDLAQEPKPAQAPASPRDSNELRAKLGITVTDSAAAVSWARSQAPST